MQSPVPETRYAMSGDVSIAYQVIGEGPLDLIHVPGWVSNVELAWQIPIQAEFYRRLASFTRLITFDKRGTGLSDRDVGVPDMETRMDDVRAVMDAAGSARAALFGASEGAPLSILFAATYPERAWALALFNGFARLAWAADYPFGLSEEELARELDNELAAWTDPRQMAEMVESVIPAADESSKRALAAAWRQSASPGALRALHRMNVAIDVREAVPSINVPTLVFARAENEVFALSGARFVADHVSGARYLELPGTDHGYAAGDPTPIIEELRDFLTDAWNARGWEEEPDRVLATVLFTDIVGSTARAAELGDRGWRELLTEHNQLTRRQLSRFRGREIDTAGDGFFASFDGPARAIRCARAISEQVRELGLEVRAGLHTGECELLDGKVAGIAVSIGARVAAQAQPGEVLVSQTVKDLVAGSGIEFDDRGAAELKGVPGEWRLYAVADS